MLGYSYALWSDQGDLFMTFGLENMAGGLLWLPPYVLHRRRPELHRLSPAGGENLRFWLFGQAEIFGVLVVRPYVE